MQVVHFIDYNENTTRDVKVTSSTSRWFSEVFSEYVQIYLVSIIHFEYGCNFLWQLTVFHNECFDAEDAQVVNNTSKQNNWDNITW